MKKLILMLCLFFAGCATIPGGDVEKKSCRYPKSHCETCTHCSPECLCKK